MRTRYIFTALAALILTSSCIKEEQGADMPEGTGFLKVKLSVPEIEVKAASTPKFYAYVPSEVQAGTLNPIPESILKKNDGAIYYNLPSDATEVVFSTFHGADGEKVDISADGEGNVWYGIDTEANSGSYFIADEILAGYVGDITVGSTEPKDVAIKRLTSKITTNFRVKDANGADLYLYNVISSVKVEYSGLGNSASVLKDGTVKSSGSHNEEITLKRHNDYLYTLDKGFIPSQEIPSVTVTITRSSGVVQTYTKSLGKKLDPNRHYTVNLNVTNINTGGLFVVNDPEVTVSQPISPTVTETEFFSVTNEMTIGGEAGNELMIDVATVLPYDWTFELDEAAAEYFSAEVVDGGIKLMAKEGNMGDIRFGNVTLKSKTGGYTKVLNIRQMSAIKHEIIMKYNGSSTYSYIVISGENITVQDPNDASPRVFKTANSTQVEINGLSDGKTVTVKGDIITDFIALYSRTDNQSYKNDVSYEVHGGYYYYLGYDSFDAYSFEFKNCRYLETFMGNPRNETLDFSQMPDLKKVVLGKNSSFSSITFAEGQSIESFVAYKCPNIQQLNLKNIVETIADIRIYDCDGVLGINFSDFYNLKSINLNECSNMGQIKLNGCSSLESFSISNNSATVLELENCTSLKDVYLGRNISLTKFLHAGSDSIESVTGYNDGSDYTIVEELDFADNVSLKVLDGIHSHLVDVSGCSNLVNLGYITGIVNLDMSDCPLLESVEVDFWSSSDETYKFDNCPKLEDVYFNDMTNPCDFSPLTALKKVHLENITGTGFTSLDFSKNTLLEDVILDSDNASSCKLNSILLPNSVKSLYVYGLYNIYAIDLSDHTNLASVDIRESYYLNDLNLSGCTALQDLNLQRVYYYSSVSGELNLSGCSSLISINRNTHASSAVSYLKEIDLAGCSALEYIDIYSAKISQLDFSDCDKLTYVDVRYNKMSAEALDAMFESLPDWSVIDADVLGIYKIIDNPGYSSCDTDIAYVKNWSEVKN